MERSWAERLAVTVAALDPCGYGIVRLDIDPAALANRQLELRRCQARLRDGTLVWLERGEEPDRVSLHEAGRELQSLSVKVADALEEIDTIRVYLAVPRFDPAAGNVAPPGPPDRSRDLVVRKSLQDDATGGNDQDVEFRKLNVTIKLSTEDLSGFELLPIAQIRRAGNREASPEIDPGYFPPMLAVDAWPPLGLEILRGTFDLVSRKAEVLAEQAVSRNVGFSSSEPGDLDRLMMLSKLLEAQATLRVIAFAPGIHPREAYTQLCRVAGQLAVFEPQRSLGDLPLYDHDNLAEIFRTVKDRIEIMIGRVVALEYEQRYFMGSGVAMLSVAMEPKWLRSDWQCYVGVQHGDLSAAECQRLLTGNAHLDWKLGSTEEVDRLFRLGLPGLELFPLERLPRALPARSGWLYYRIGTDNPAYKSAQLTQTLAIRVRDSSIVNAAELNGRRKIEVAYDGRVASLEFAVFAVPN